MDQPNARPGLSPTRRQFLKGATATTTALAANAYVKPSLRALGVPSALAAISGGPPPPASGPKKGPKK